MRAVEVTGRIDEKGQLILDKPIEITPISSVRIIILFSEPTDEL